MKRAFTLIEMIFVIVVLSIVLGSTFVSISSVYEDMLQKSASDEMQEEAAQIADTLVVRMSSAIKESMVAMTDVSASSCYSVSDPSLTNQTQYILSWVAKSEEANKGLWVSSIGDYVPGWNGFADIANTNTTTLSSPGSRFSNAEAIIDMLGNPPLTNALSQSSQTPVALYFVPSSSQDTGNLNACTNFGYTGGSVTKLFQVQKNDDEHLMFITQPQIADITEQYALTDSAYAVSLENNGSENDGSLYLYSFRPWLGEKPNHDTTNARFLLGTHVTGFGFKWDNGLMRINVCVGKKPFSGSSYTIQACKERMLY